jgi:tetratricopeptide (TPR) repeat protein
MNMYKKTLEKLAHIGSTLSVFLNRKTRPGDASVVPESQRSDSIDQDRRRFSVRFLFTSLPLLELTRTGLARFNLGGIAPTQPGGNGGCQGFTGGREELEKDKKALARWRELGDLREEGKTLMNMGKIHYRVNENQPAYDYFNQALRIWERLNDPEGMAESHFYIAGINAEFGNLSLAHSEGLRALELWQSSNNLEGEARSKLLLAVVKFQLGDKEQAFNLYREVSDISRRLGNRFGEIASLNGLGYAYLESGRERNAIEAADNALMLAEQLGTMRSLGPQSIAHSTLGQAYTRLGDYKRAILHITKQLEINRRIGDHRLEGYALKNFGSIYEGLGERQKALGYYERALALHREVRNSVQESATLNHIGYLHELNGDRGRALEYYLAARQIRTENIAEETRTLENIARVSG